MNWVFHYESWHSAVGPMDRDRSYDLTAFPPSMAVIADQAHNDGIPLSKCHSDKRVLNLSRYCSS